MSEHLKDIPTEDLVKGLIDDRALRALIGTDMRAKDVRAAVLYYQRGLDELQKGDIEAARVCARALEGLTMQWASFQHFVNDLYDRIRLTKLDKLKFEAQNA